MFIEDRGDPFTDHGMWVVLAACALLGMLTFFGLGLIYYGDNAATPPWSEKSEPPPRAY